MRKICWIGLLLFGAAMPANGQWQLIDDFEQWEVGQEFTEATDIGWHGYCPDGTDHYWIMDDPEDSNNITLFVESRYSEVGYGDVWIQKELPDGGIAPGMTGTLFCRCNWIRHLPWHFGTADKNLAYDEVTGLQVAPGAWDDYNVLIRMGEASNIEHRDGAAYVSTYNPVQVVEDYQWYSLWLVVENTWDTNTIPPTSTGVYTLYVQGPGIGDGVNPTLIPVGTVPPKDKASFRRSPVDMDGNPQAIIWAQFATFSLPGSPSAPYEFRLDDFYFSKGENITNPLFYGGFPANGSRDVDTGGYLGWINVAQAPYIWSYALNGWIFMDELDPDAQGSWGYFYK